ncbi:sodium- and chloride-dependent neutral and basic amino acid transporter B(0+)-like [Vanessa cardui]|uniref:sodium- and chloride-dependent neutral and basic amino acid transporter B(0+)-like n=1 Tax=Vanessa cardui TaxID=171605 RepID=UPI001F12FFDD|nr:sodium- and chloride-dependent neutral and basic amino acid transporter B(0+)-like [Vanessa cardui]
MLNEEGENQWSSRKVYIMVLICQFIGTSNVNSIPSNALLQGTFGYTIFLTVFYVFMGIPILYMESVVGQFTTRDCVDAWKIRPCFSYIGYIVVLWQVAILIFNHIVTSFLIHYFLISFESPVPFYTCGSWSSKFCNSLVTNYTVNQDCIKYQNLFPYCDNLYKTFPEYEYWRHNLVRPDNAGYKIAWKVCLASGLICFFVYIGCFKRSKSLKWFVGGFAVYPMLALMILLIGSMRQKGLVVKFEEALDLDFANFKKRFRLSNLIHQIVFNLNIGTGVVLTLSSSTSFRNPCFSDMVIAVFFTTVFSIMFVFTIAMMTCPYAFEYGVQTLAIIKTPMTLNFEKFPRLLYLYEDKTFYLIVMFSCNATLGICTSVMLFFNIIEVIFKRSPKLSKYPGLTTFCSVVFMFIITIPFLSYNGVNVVALSFRRYISIFSTFLAILECLVFLIWYGINKFAEDVHFMLGIKPKNCIKVSWILSIMFLIYAFVTEVYYQVVTASNFIYATYVLLFIVSFLIFVFIIRILYAACKNKAVKYLSLDPSWGPTDDLLQRSRAMFSAQAMTKEYIYRQYSLQAGIMARQKNANKRVCYR